MFLSTITVYYYDCCEFVIIETSHLAEIMFWNWGKMSGTNRDNMNSVRY